MSEKQSETAPRARPPATEGDRAERTQDSGRWAVDTTIRETPGVCGGYPRVGHTRVSVRNIVVVHRETGNDFERTAAVFDMLTREQVRAALDYYAEQPARVDEDIARNERAWAAIAGREWPG